MLERRVEQQVEKYFPENDEGWWAAILADESSNHPDEEENHANVSGVDGTEINWERVKAIHQQDEIVCLFVQGCNRGGILVEGEEIQGFVPVSHLLDVPNTIRDEDRSQLLKGYIGRKINLKIIEYDPSQERVVFSERAALAGEGKRKHLLENLRGGEVVSGEVTNVTDFGVFVDLGGVEGLIHVSELSWGRVQHPQEVLQVGQTIKTLVMQVNEESARVALSYKRLYQNPWDKLSEHYRIGDIVPAKITAVVNFGAFARIENGIEGLIHVSSMDDYEDQPDPIRIFIKGEELFVKILHIDICRRRLGLAVVKPE